MEDSGDIVDNGLRENPTAKIMYREIYRETQNVVDLGRRRGDIYEPSARWDQQDQDDFDQVPIETLLDDPQYGGGKFQVEEIGDEFREKQGLWPEHRQDIIHLWNAREKYGVDTFVDIEGIGSGKTHKFRTALKLDVMKVLTRVSPLEYYGLDPEGQGIAFVCMSRNAKLAKAVTFSTVLKAFDCPFFSKHFPPLIDIRKVQDAGRFPGLLRFPKDVVIFPGTGSALSAVGYNLFGGGIDEANYLEVVTESKKAIQGSHYDAAEIMYHAIRARMKSRFIGWIKKYNRLPGLLSLFSNTRRKGDFLERMAIKARTDRTIFFRRRCTWDAQPKEKFSGKCFNFDVVNRQIVDDDGMPIPINRISRKSSGF